MSKASNASWREKLSQPIHEVGDWELDVPIKARDGTDSRGCMPSARQSKFSADLMSAYGKDIQHPAHPGGRRVGLLARHRRHQSGMTILLRFTRLCARDSRPARHRALGGEYDIRGTRNSRTARTASNGSPRSRGATAMSACSACRILRACNTSWPRSSHRT
jgi:hypothetical protein